MCTCTSSLDNITYNLSVSCSAQLVPSNAHIADQSNTIYLEGTMVTFQCDNGSQALLTTCHVNGDWIPPPDELDCNPRSGRHIAYLLCRVRL